jgi:O-antigen/teichoic acid export membrane protein
MIEARLLSAWDGFIGTAALFAIIALGFCVMVRVVGPGDILRHLGVIVGIAILLVMLPAIIVELWHSMTFGQHIEITTGLVAIIVLITAAARKSRKERH